MKNTFFVWLMLCSFVTYGQVVINEIDADTPSVDLLEFVELKSTTPNFSLDGYVLVFYNGGSGTGKLSYLAIDLDGYSTDINGIVHFGNAAVSPEPVFITGNSTIQNGPDVVALYLGNATDFPMNTIAHTSGVIDALAYSNNGTAQPTELMSVFGLTVCVNENQTSSAASHSIQRKNDGTYEVKAPTPGVNNDGSGVILNYVTTSLNTTALIEGQSFIISFSTTQPVQNQPLTINFTLNNYSFDTNDYSGNTTVTIPVGSSNGSTSIQILNDLINEGDEELKIVVNALPYGYASFNNNIIVRVDDVNFSVSPWGTPLNPTFGIVTNTMPSGYYSSLEGLSGTALKQGIQNIIANPNVVRAHNYGDLIEILKDADQNPLNGNKVWLMYVEQPRSKIDFQETSSNVGKWNREHIYPQSRGYFANATSSTADGISVWLPTNADDIAAGHADAHHIRAEDGTENTARSNRDYGLDYNGPAGSQGSWNGDVARSLFYMAVRYNVLSLVNGNPPDTTTGELGDLATLLQWNQSDPSDDFEMNRNNIIYNWQINRNPFIDFPALADYIWGANAGQAWYSNLSTQQFAGLNVILYPNPAKNYITVSGIAQDGQIEIYNISGMKLMSTTFTGETQLNIDLASGIYLAKITSEGKTTIKKIMIQ